MDDAGALARISASPIGHLGTVRPGGAPHIVPVTFALDGSHIVTAIDHKPKSTVRLQRLANIEANPTVTFMVDRYSDDWERLWWVRVDGKAEIRHNGIVFDSAVAALRDKYHQYRGAPLNGPVISITTDRIHYWESTP